MSITPVNLTDTFDIWRTRTNQIINLTSSIESNVANVSAATVAAFSKANTANYFAFLVNANTTAAFAIANASYIIANSAFDKANTATLIGTNAFDKGNSATTIGSSAFGQANLAFGQANTATTIGVAAFGKANNALANTSGAVFAGDLIITGNVTISGGFLDLL
jgi:hypothetical protein